MKTFKQAIIGAVVALLFAANALAVTGGDLYVGYARQGIQQNPVGNSYVRFWCSWQPINPLYFYAWSYRRYCSVQSYGYGMQLQYSQWTTNFSTNLVTMTYDKNCPDAPYMIRSLHMAEGQIDWIDSSEPDRFITYISPWRDELHPPPVGVGVNCGPLQ